MAQTPTPPPDPLTYLLEGRLGPPIRGKVRDMWVLPEGQRLIVTTDRQSAFDVVLGRVPQKGQISNLLAAWWFRQTAEVVPNHVIATPDPNAMITANARPWPVEMVIRGYITGVTTTSLWPAYERGERKLYGHRLPDGLIKNQILPKPLITPTTKGESGEHDRPLTKAQLLAEGLVPPDVYAKLETATRALFARGQAIAASRGLILVDSKYEFGDVDGNLTLIDEIHTPDSSRFWLANSYAAHLASGQEPEGLDKEFLRRWYADKGYHGQGEPPPMPSGLVQRLSRLYIEAYERLTGEKFKPAEEPSAARLVRNLEAGGWIPAGEPAPVRAPAVPPAPAATAEPLEPTEPAELTEPLETTPTAEG